MQNKKENSNFQLKSFVNCTYGWLCIETVHAVQLRFVLDEYAHLKRKICSIEFASPTSSSSVGAVIGLRDLLFIPLFGDNGVFGVKYTSIPKRISAISTTWTVNLFVNHVFPLLGEWKFSFSHLTERPFSIGLCSFRCSRCQCCRHCLHA